MQSAVTLKTGEVVQGPLVKIGMLVLSQLMESNPIAFYELVTLCRNPQHKVFGNIGEVLCAAKVAEKIDGEYIPEESFKALVLAAVEGEGLEMRMVNPLKDEDAEFAAVKAYSIEDPSLIPLMRKIGDIIFEHASSEVECADGVNWPQDRRDEGPNPFYDQTASGFFLELYYGQPSKLWTPWGSWSIGGSGSGSWRAIMPTILERLGATVHMELRTSIQGEFGPVYALHKVDDQPLPEPVVLSRKAYDSYEAVNAAWKNANAALEAQQ